MCSTPCQSDTSLATVILLHSDTTQGMDQQEVPVIVSDVPCELEAENETGYSSYDSSCHHDDGSENSWKQNPFSVCSLSKEPSTASSPSQPVNDWCCTEDETMQGVNEIEDLLYHFEKFFQEKLECHVTEFSNAMHSMLSEQQIHVRHIVKSALCVEQNQEEDLPQAFEQEDILKSEMGYLDMQKKDNDMLYSNNVRTQLLVELMSLSCEMSSLLHQDKFRS